MVLDFENYVGLEIKHKVLIVYDSNFESLSNRKYEKPRTSNLALT